MVDSGLEESLFLVPVCFFHCPGIQCSAGSFVSPIAFTAQSCSRLCSHLERSQQCMAIQTTFFHSLLQLASKGSAGIIPLTTCLGTIDIISPSGPWSRHHLLIPELSRLPLQWYHSNLKKNPMASRRATCQLYREETPLPGAFHPSSRDSGS